MPSPPAGAHEFEAAAESAPERLDRFLVEALRGAGFALSRSRAQALIAEGRATLDGATAIDPGAPVRAGARAILDMPAPVPAKPRGETIPLVVVHEDADLIVIDKPAGLVVHPAPGHAGGTLVNALIAHCGDSLSGVGGERRPGIVHRLDKDTSGLLVVAKNDSAHRALSELFADHGRTLGLEREYLALVWGAPAASRGTVDAPLARSTRNREKIAVVGQGAGKGSGREARTHWRLLERLGEASLVACRLETGRTHQIRVHMAHVGLPLLGDGVYGAGHRTKASRLGADARAALEALGRQALHARLLAFPHPVTGEPMRFESAPPADFARLAEALRR
ncbi:MAG: RluA family pseudouridine synthase [Hyphomicrobiales bacterium]|nr:RluA family pseudouridine synthase [Hyphomicrobiales bacterium]